MNKDDPDSRIYIDIAKSVIFAIPIALLLAYFESQSAILANIGKFNSTITTLLAPLLTVLAILYTFESEFEDNDAVKKLKNMGQYENIHKIYVYSITSIGVIWFITLTLAIFQPHSHFGRIVEIAFSFVAIFGFILVVIRMWRSFYIFVLLKTAMERVKDD